MTLTVERHPSAGWAPRRRPDLVSVSLDGETVLYDGRGDALHVLDPIASSVWHHLNGVVTADCLSAELAQAYGAPAATVQADVQALLTRLLDCGLLTGPIPPGTPPPIGGQPAPDMPPTAGRAVGRTTTDGPIDGPVVGELPHCAVDDVATPYRTARCRALQHDFAVESNDAGVCSYLDEVFGDFADAGLASTYYRLLDLGADAGPARWYLEFEGRPVATAGWRGRVLALLLWHVNQEVVRTSAPYLVLVHAAAAVRDGIGVLLPAPQESGKTTTVAGLIRTGFSYLTDEAAAIEPDTLRIRPFPKSLSVDRGSWDVLPDLRPWHAEEVAGQWQVPASRVRLGALAPPTRPGLVVTPRYRAGSTTALSRITRADMLVLLADATFAFHANPERNLEVLGRVVAGCDCYRLTIGDLDHAVDLVHGLVDTHPR